MLGTKIDSVEDKKFIIIVPKTKFFELKPSNGGLKALPQFSLIIDSEWHLILERVNQAIHWHDLNGMHSMPPWQSPLFPRRWSCCDSTTESEFGIGGCQKRWHVARQEDKGYKYLLEQEEERDSIVTSELKTAMTDADEALRKNRKQGMGLMNAAIANLKSERDIVERFKDLKWQWFLQNLEFSVLLIWQSLIRSVGMLGKDRHFFQLVLFDSSVTSSF